MYYSLTTLVEKLTIIFYVCQFFCPYQLVFKSQTLTGEKKPAWACSCLIPVANRELVLTEIQSLLFDVMLHSAVEFIIPFLNLSQHKHSLPVLLTLGNQVSNECLHRHFLLSHPTLPAGLKKIPLETLLKPSHYPHYKNVLKYICDLLLLSPFNTK